MSDLEKAFAAIEALDMRPQVIWVRDDSLKYCLWVEDEKEEKQERK